MLSMYNVICYHKNFTTCMIKTIFIENVKGIGSGQKSKSFDLDIVPNKPSLIIAPNGFGKSSFAAAFKSMNRERINLDKKDCFNEDETKVPVLKLKFRNHDQNIIELIANDNSNTIADNFDYYVINSSVKAKGVGQNFGGRVNVSALLSVDPIIFIDRILDNVSLNYSFTTQKNTFGNGKKVLVNLNNLLVQDKELKVC
jgi:hypothetical protein